MVAEGIPLESRSPADAQPLRRAMDSERKARTRKRLLDAGFRLIGHERGRSVRIEEICVEAKVSHGSFYNYFSSVDALIEALAYNLVHDFILAVIAEMNRLPSAAERADLAIRSYLERARTDRAWGWAMVNIGATGPLFGAETAESALDTIEAGIASGEFTITDAGTGRDLVLGTCHAALITFLRNGGATDQPLYVSRAVLGGLGVPAKRIDAILDRPLPQFGSTSA